MNITMILRMVVVLVFLGMIGGAFYLGIQYGESKKDSQELKEQDAAFDRLFEAEIELDELRKARKEKTHERIRIIRQAVDSCADTIPSADIKRVLDESDTAGKS